MKNFDTDDRKLCSVTRRVVRWMLMLINTIVTYGLKTIHKRCLRRCCIHNKSATVHKTVDLLNCKEMFSRKDNFLISHRDHTNHCFRLTMVWFSCNNNIARCYSWWVVSDQSTKADTNVGTFIRRREGSHLMHDSVFLFHSFQIIYG